MKDIKNEEVKRMVDQVSSKTKSFNCTCIECGHKQTSQQHCKDLKCSNCGGQMRRNSRPGVGKKNKSLIIKVLNHSIDKSEPSVLINDFILINVPQIQKRIEVDDILLTHTHRTNVEGFSQIIPKENSKVHLLKNKTHLHFLKFHFNQVEETYFLKQLDPYKSFKLNELEITPILLKHQVQEIYGSDCLGFKFNDQLIYASPCNLIPTKSLNYFRGVKVVIIDGGYMGKALYSDHKSILNTLKELAPLNIPYIYFLGTFKGYRIQGQLRGTSTLIDTLFTGNIIKI